MEVKDILPSALEYSKAAKIAIGVDFMYEIISSTVLSALSMFFIYSSAIMTILQSPGNAYPLVLKSKTVGSSSGLIET